MWFFSHSKYNTGSCQNSPLLSLFTDWWITVFGINKQKHTGENVQTNAMSTCVMWSVLFKFGKNLHIHIFICKQSEHVFIKNNYFMIFAKFLWLALFRILRRREKQTRSKKKQIFPRRRLVCFSSQRRFYA